MKYFSYAALMSAVVGTLTFTGIAEANSVMKRSFNPLFGRNVKQVTSLTKIDSTRECANFSGNWVGSCTDSDGETYDESISMEQSDCSRIELVGFTELKIGGVYEQSNSDESFVMKNMLYPQWGSSRQSLKIKHYFNGRVLNADIFFSGDGLVEFSMLDSTLIIKSRNTSEYETSGRTEISNFWSECTYQKTDSK